MADRVDLKLYNGLFPVSTLGMNKGMSVWAAGNLVDSFQKSTDITLPKGAVGFKGKGDEFKFSSKTVVSKNSYNDKEDLIRKIFPQTFATIDKIENALLANTVKCFLFDNICSNLSKGAVYPVVDYLLNSSLNKDNLTEMLKNNDFLDNDNKLFSNIYDNPSLIILENNKLADKFTLDDYQNIYLNNMNFPDSIRKKCVDISEKYGVKVLLNELPEETNLKILDTINKELEYWKYITNQKMPLIFDMSNIKPANEVNENDIKNPFIMPIEDFENLSSLLRHEMLRALSSGVKSEKFISDVIFKKISSSEYVDIDNCKYIDELVKAGINPKLIQYAYSSPSEFFAIALSGNTAAYSEEFKNVLSRFLPCANWINKIFNRPQVKPINYTQKEIAERVEFVKNDYKKKLEQLNNDSDVKSLNNIFNGTFWRDNMAKLSQDSVLGSVFYDINIEDILNKVKDGDKPVTLMKLESLINGYHIPLSEINKFRNKLMQEGFNPEVAFIKLIQTLDVYTLITNHPLFKLIPLTFNDVYTLKENFQGDCYPKETIEDIIQEKIELTYDENFYDIEAEIVSEANMYLYVDLQRRLMNRTDYKFDKIQVFNDVQINGEPLSLVVNEHLSIGDNSDVKLETEELIKSNIVTLELINNSVIADAIIAKHQGECIEKAKINEKAFDYKINISNAINKLKSGEKLVSQEIHILTDALMQLYESDLKFQNEIDKTINQSDVQNKIAKIRSIVSAIRKQIPANKNVEITNHFILRMIDRNILTAYNIEDKKQYSLNELFELIMQTCNKAKPVGDSQVSLNNKDTQIAPKLEFLIKADNGKFVFDTILN